MGGKGKGKGGDSSDDDLNKGKGKKGKGSGDSPAPKGDPKGKGKSKSYDDDGGKGKSKGKKGKKGKGKGKKGNKGDDVMSRKRKNRKKVEVALEDLDFEVPKLYERIEQNCIQGEMDMKILNQLREEAMKRKAEVKALNDPADFKRQYKCHVCVNGISNATNAPWETFMAITMSKEGKSDIKHQKLKANYSYSRSYIVAPGAKTKLKIPEKVYTKMFKGSYKDLKNQELRMDFWCVVSGNFNQHLGTATRNLYECGSEAVYQQVMVKGFKAGNTESYDLGIVHLSAMVSEVFTYTINCQNWQFVPANPRLAGPKSLSFKVPSGTGAFEFHQTGVCPGPPYSWTNCGQFRFDGTAIALSVAVFEVSVLAGGGLQGKAVISLGGAGDYPIAMGAAKQLTDNVKDFVQGQLGGGISLHKKSLLLEDDEVDIDPSVPAPVQPPASVVMYNLDPSLQYLLIDVASADGLPVADIDLGTSHPFVRVRYDGIVQQSPVVEGTLRPVWNHLFYIPVQYIEPDIRVNPRYMTTLLPEELKCKGFCEIEVWHMDGVPTEFLGCVKFDLRMTRFGESQERAVCERMAKLQKASGQEVDDSDDEGEDGKDKEEESEGIHPKLMRKHSTKVYTAARQKLTGCRLQATQPAKITFQACFIPDFPEKLVYPEQPATRDFGKDFNYDKWDEKWPPFVDAYQAWYPDSPTNRRFPCQFQDMRGAKLPLPYLISALALPASLGSPGQVLHWVRCLEFNISSKQKNKGSIDKWQAPDTTLAMRKGSVQDHAVLLCCALLGLRKDAWVCLGTVKQGNFESEHAWVMTREKGGCVTFWEAATGAKYHLPLRWSDDPAKGPKMKGVVDQRHKSRKIRPDWKEQASQRKTGGRRVQLADMDDLVHLPFSPFMGLVKPDKIVPLPYISIEVVFNNKQLYGNVGNHNPACIYYDFEQDSKGWAEFLEKKMQVLLAEVHTAKGVAIPVGPAISDFTAQALQANIDTEVKESIRMTRLRRGHESVFDEKNETMQSVLTQYLDSLEQEIRLDIDWRVDPKGKPEKPPGHPSPFNSQQYVNESRKAWSKYWKNKKVLDDNRKFLPVKSNHVLSGVPFHFSGTDIKEIRFHLMEYRAIAEYIAIPNDDVVYFVVTKVFPMASSVASVWCWVGVEMPLSAEEVYDIASELEKTKNAPKAKAKAKAPATST